MPGSTSSTIRFAEPAGSHESDPHYQLGLNYTQNFALPRGINFQLRGDVFNEDFIANWIDMKQKEYDALRLRPHPYEFAMYYDV